MTKKIVIYLVGEGDKNLLGMEGQLGGIFPVGVMT